jgi:hypothetical protein
LIPAYIWPIMGFMKAIALAFSLISLGFAAADPWSKVIALKSGSEVRILKSGDKQPLSGQFSEADEERVIVVVKSTQFAITRAEIERVEAKPKGAKALKSEQRNVAQDPNVELAKPKPPGPGSSPTPALQSGSSGVTYTKPGFELIYSKGMK